MTSGPLLTNPGSPQFIRSFTHRNAAGQGIMNFQRLTLTTLAAILSTTAIATAASDPAPTKTAVPLALDQVVDNLVRRNQERAQALRATESTRIYHLAYRGFPGDREAEMTVRALYSSPSSKNFEVISQSGSRIILDRVFKRLLEGEIEAAQPAVHDRTLVNRANYDFELVRYEPSSAGGQYVLKLNPKSKNKFLYRGQIWVDANDFAIARIEAEPAQNPSFWIKRSEVRHEYMRVQGFWLPARNQSISYIRLGGRATLTIEYKDYKLNTGTDSAAISTAKLPK